MDIFLILSLSILAPLLSVYHPMKTAFSFHLVKNLFSNPFSRRTDDSLLPVLYKIVLIILKNLISKTIMYDMLLNRQNSHICMLHII